MNLPLSCKCGAVTGTLSNATEAFGNRAVCCCSDCQTFADYLGGEALDKFGGTDIYQTAMSQVQIHTGLEHVRCLRLSPKGLLRWYSTCCNTPIGNTINARIPLVGLIHTFIDPTIDRDAALGPVRAYVQTQHARGNPDYPHSAKKFPPGITLRLLRKMLTWKVKGLGKPSAFFDENGKPISEPSIQPQ